jgi:hypothetical protein
MEAAKVNYGDSEAEKKTFDLVFNSLTINSSFLAIIFSSQIKEKFNGR